MRDAVGFFDAVLALEIVLWNALDGAVQSGQGLSLGRLQALRVARDRGGRARVQDMAEDLRITVGAASKLVDRLERDGMARREPNPADRRSSLIGLTSEGGEVLQAGSATFELELAELLPPEVVSEAELASATATLQRLVGHLTPTAREVGAA